jgi:acetamidase/formamidase
MAAEEPMKRFSRTATQMFFDREIEPVGSVRPGESFVVETADAVCGLIRTDSDVLSSFDELLDRLGGANPVTGPIHVEGARPGDCIAVTFEDLVVAPTTGTGWTTIIPGWGGLTHDRGYTILDSLAPRSAICRIEDGEARFGVDGREVRVPVEPFLGTVGVAPKLERRMSLSQSAEYLGDADIRAVGVGSTLILPVHVDGALLALGDAHAAQGEGEVTGIAVEVEADVRLRVEVLSGEQAQYGRFPMLETEEWVGVIVGQQGVPLTACVQAGYVDLCRRLERYHGFTREGAYTLLGQVGRVRIGNMVDPFYSCLVTLPRRYLAP